jgi:hypothetical protein
MKKAILKFNYSYVKDCITEVTTSKISDNFFIFPFLDFMVVFVAFNLSFKVFFFFPFLFFILFSLMLPYFWNFFILLFCYFILFYVYFYFLHLT